LAAGRIAFIASDHSPSPPEMKSDANFFKVWGGIAGVQSTLPILLSRAPSLPLKLVADLVATNVAQRYRLPEKGRIEIGMDADLALVDLPGRFELKREHLFDRHKLSPYVGRTFHGVVKMSLVRGSVVFDNGKVVARNGGRLIKPARP